MKNRFGSVISCQHPKDVVGPVCITVTVVITIIDYVGRHWMARSSAVILMLTISRK